MEPRQAAEKLAPRIRALAARIDADRELPEELADELAEAGLFRMLVPRSLGGFELDFPEYVRVVEIISRADGSTGWCINQGGVIATIAARLPPETGREIWLKNPRSVIANGPPPGGKATEVEGGYRVTGRWTFSSGCRHANWMAGLSTLAENGVPRRRPDGRLDVRMLLFPRSEAQILDVWHVRGMRGTGSHHFEVADLFVPQRCSVSIFDPRHEPGPLYALPLNLMFACGFGSVALGIARTAIDTVVELCAGKRPVFSRTQLRDQGGTHRELGRAEATWRAARAFLHEAVGEVWRAVSARGEIDLEQRVLLRMAGTHAIRQAADAVDLVYGVAGTDGIYESSPLQRCFQDVHVITQHMQGRLSHYELVGQLLLGMEPDERFL